MSYSINYKRIGWLLWLWLFPLGVQSASRPLTQRTARHKAATYTQPAAPIKAALQTQPAPQNRRTTATEWPAQAPTERDVLAAPDAADSCLRRLPVDELLKLGRENSLRLQASRLRQTIAEAREKTARTTRLPDMHLGATVGYLGRATIFQHGLSRPRHPDLPDWSHNYNLEITQPLYRGGKIRHTLRKAELEKQIVEFRTVADQAEIKLLLLRYYLDLFNLYKEKEVWNRTLEESARRLKDIRQMRKEGLVTRNDELRSQLQLTNDRLALRETADNIAIVSQQLDQLTGLDEQTVILPDTALLHTVPPLSDCETYIGEAYLNYPELTIAHYDTRLARHDISLARADYLPALTLRAANTLSRPLSTTMEDLFSNNWNIALTLSYNLSALYQNPHKMHEARQYVRLRQNAEEQLRQDLRRQVRTAYIKHLEALDRVRALGLSVEQAEENYRIVNNRYKNQLSILTDLLDASNVRLEAELQLTAARTEVLYTYYQLLRASGLL